MTVVEFGWTESSSVMMSAFASQIVSLCYVSNFIWNKIWFETGFWPLIKTPFKVDYCTYVVISCLICSYCCNDELLNYKKPKVTNPSKLN